MFQYKWLCKTTNGDDCLMTGNYPELKETMDDKSLLTSSELIIHELTLQPGRYNLKLYEHLLDFKIYICVIVYIIYTNILQIF